jgi:hypothetical protein
MAKGYDPLEDIISVAPSQKRTAKQPPATPEITDKMELARHALEGTPVIRPEPPQAKVVMPPPPPPPKGQRYRVMETKVIHIRGSLTKLAKGSIVSEHTHDLGILADHKVALEPIG